MTAVSGKHKKILVIRFSALGDVAMTVPVVKTFLQNNPEIRLAVLSNSQNADLFADMPRLEFIGADLKGRHKGFIGIFKIFNTVRRQVQFDAVADLHGVLRSHILRLLFLMIGKKTAVIDKGRFEKYALVRKENKIFRPLPHAMDRYMQVFQKIGFPVAHPEFTSEGLLSEPPKLYKSRLELPQTKNGGPIRLGFAPFAAHHLKMYDLDKIKEVIRYFDRKPYQLYFFGGTPAEKLFIQYWEKQFRHAVSIPKGTGLQAELELMKGLRLMVSMDSANMHLASLAGIPVISLWGPTHPFAGFSGYNQDPVNAIQRNDLSCRPCSVYGRGSCWRGDHACMQGIAPETVIQKIESLII